MKLMKRGLAVLLAVLLMMPTLPVEALGTDAIKPEMAEMVQFNTGNHTYSVVMPGEPSIEETAEESMTEESSVEVQNTAPEESGGVNEETVPVAESSADADETTGSSVPPIIADPILSMPEGDAYFEEDGSYTINIPEENPFFPYEVQFTCDGTVTQEWFMDPYDSIVVGGHTFYVNASFDNTAVTQMSLNVAGDTVIVYPKEKEFTEEEGIMPMSLLPLATTSLTVDFSGYSPVDLSHVAVQDIFAGEEALQAPYDVVWKLKYYNGDNYEVSTSGEYLDLSSGFSNTGSYSRWEMIVGEADQLAASNIKYDVNVQYTGARWLIPTLYIQSENGERKEISQPQMSSFYSQYLDIWALQKDLKSAEQVYLGLQIDKNSFPKSSSDHIKFYEGKYATAAEAEAAGKDITSQLLADMTQTDAGYLINQNYDSPVTAVSYGADGNVIGCMYFSLRLRVSPTGVDCSVLRIKTDDGWQQYPYSEHLSENLVSGSKHLYTLLAEYPVDAEYNVIFSYVENYSMSFR